MKKSPKPPSANKMLAEKLSAEMMGHWSDGMGDESDRVVAIVGAAYLDSVVEQLLRSVFLASPDAVNQLMRPDGPLGANGTRFQIAYLLGLVRDDQRADMKSIATIRNRFAHNFRTLTFEGTEVRDLCANLKQPALLTEVLVQRFDDTTAKNIRAGMRESMKSPREAFKLSVGILFSSMLRRIEQVRNASTLKWFVRDPDREFRLASSGV